MITPFSTAQFTPAVYQVNPSTSGMPVVFLGRKSGEASGLALRYRMVANCARVSALPTPKRPESEYPVTRSFSATNVTASPYHDE